jgi:hypothetical protein
MDPIVTGHLIANTHTSGGMNDVLSSLMAGVLTLGFLLWAVHSVRTRTTSRFDDETKKFVERPRTLTARLGWAAIALVLALVFGIPAVVTIHGVVTDTGHSGADDRVIHGEIIASAISSKYELDQITGTEDIETVAGEDPSPERTAQLSEHIERLCAPASPKSFELAGVTSGHEVRFRVGFEDCDDPDPEIIIISAPDQAMTPKDLERR